MFKPSLALATALVLLASPAFGQEPDPAVVKRILATADAIQKDVERLRGHKFRIDVPKGVQLRAKMRKAVVGSMEKEFKSQKNRDGEKIAKVFGLIPESFNFGKGVADFYGSQIGGYYDPQAKRLFLIAADKKSAMPGQETNDQFVMAHELGHALQDQHHDLMRWQRITGDNEDTGLSMKAVIEGEATLIGLRWLAKKQPMMGKMSVKAFFEMNRRMAKMMPQANPGAKALAKMPRYLIDSAMFPYDGGGNFVEEVVKARGWKGVDRLFHSPPRSTEQILHPQKYLSKKPDEPITVKMLKLHEILGEGYRDMQSETMGEFQLRLLFEVQGLSAADAADAAGGWGGDSYQAFERKKDKSTLIVWLSAWDRASDAQEFYSHYRKVLAKRFKGKKHNWTLRRRGKMVLWIDGANPKEQVQLERLAFQSALVRESFTPLPTLTTKPPLSDFEDAVRGDPSLAAAEGERINDEELGVSFNLPAKGWITKKEKIKQLRQFSRGYYNSKDGKEELRFLELPVEYNEKDLRQRLEALVRQGMKNFKRHGMKTLKIGGRRAFRVDLEGVMPGDKTPSRAGLIAVDFVESTILFLYRAPIARWTKSSEEFKAMVSSVQITKNEPPAAITQGERVESGRELFSIVRPKGWKAVEIVNGAKSPVVLEFEDNRGATFVATHISSPQKVNLARLARNIEAQTSFVQKGYEKVRASYRKLSDLNCFSLDYLAGRGKNRRRYRHIVFALTKRTEMHLVLSCSAKLSGDYNKLFDGLLRSMEFISPDAKAPAFGGKGSKPRLRVKLRPRTRSNKKVKLY